MSEHSTTTVEKLNKQTGEIIPVQELPSDIAPYQGISTKRVTPEQEKTLTDKVDENELDVLPTGEIYLSQIGYRRRLNKSFGPGGWALVPRSHLMSKGNLLCREYALFAEGRFIAEAIGEQEYYPNNPRMSYASAAESVKSNALMRCCKDLGVASECWDKRFTEGFKTKFCVIIDNPNPNSRTKKIWVRKGKEDQMKAESEYSESEQPTQSTQGSMGSATGITSITPGQVAMVKSALKRSGKDGNGLMQYLIQEIGVEGIEQIPADKINNVLKWLEAK